MPDLETLSARAIARSREHDALIAVASSAQRVVVIRAGLGAPLHELARSFHAASPQAGAPLLSLDAAGLAREEDSDAPYQSARRGRVALFEPQRSRSTLQLRLAQRLRRWRAGSAGAPRVLALFAGEPNGLELELEEALDGACVRHAPLAERRADIARVARAWLARTGLADDRLTEQALRVLEALPWPGGERELGLWLERALALAGDGALDTAHVAPPLLEVPHASAAPAPLAQDRSLAALEAAWIRRVLAEEGGNVRRCAQVLGIHRSTLHAKLRAYAQRGLHAAVYGRIGQGADAPRGIRPR